MEVSESVSDAVIDTYDETSPKAAFCLENRFNSFADNGIDSVSVIVNSVILSFFSGGKSDIEEVHNLF